MGLSVGVTVWLSAVASTDATPPVVALGAVASISLAATLAVGRAEPIVGALALLGAAYTIILVIDEPVLDGRSAIIGAALLAIGELGYLSVELRPAVTEEAGAATRRVAFVAMMTLIALGVGSAMLALVDLLRTGGIAIEAVGVAAAVGVVGLLVLAAREAPARARRDRP
ncbi:MAG: hypothetical protein LH654_02170 [Thermoleophilia bacterium]|nr:hypothetical protein [Thermoleophilia bacterium]